LPSAVVERFLGIRQHDRRDTAVGFATLLVLMAGHAILETARDTLFLTTLPAKLLPWAYFLIALIALVLTEFNRRLVARFSRRRVLAVTLLAGAAINVGFWTLSSLAGSTWSLVTFYVWTGLFATVAVVQFWLLLGDVLDLSQAKRVFAFIGAGGLIGAVIGSGLAGLVLMKLPAQVLLVVASSLFVVASFLPFLFTRVRQKEGVKLRVSGVFGGVELARRDPYLRRLLGFVLLSTLTVTVVDFVFKSVVAAEVPRAELGDFFARYYGGLNLLALGVQVLAAPRLLRAVGVNRTLLVMPVLLVAGAVGAAFSLSLASVLLLRGADGALRHSVNRTGTEILFLPLSSEVRERFKAFADVVGQRGGQALASLAILGALMLGLEVQTLAILVVVLAFGCALCVLDLERYYLDIFRRQLKEGAIETRVEVSELDLQTLEVLLSALSAEDDVEVIAALDLFAAYHKVHLIPALVLYHPSRSVVLRAFELLEGSARRDVARLAGRLLQHADHEIRAAALRYYASTDASPEMFRRCIGMESPPVRATALVGAITRNLIDGAEAERALRGVLEGDSDEARQALALSLHLLAPERYAWVAQELVARDAALAPTVAHSLSVAPAEQHLPILLQLLGDARARSEARDALLKLGDVALDALETAMTDAHLPRGLRRHLPRTISRFGGRRAAAMLQRFLMQEGDDAIEYKILRGLGRMRASDPALPVDERQLIALAGRYLRAAIQALFWRQAVDFARAREPRVNTPAGELLSLLLFDHEGSALERVFRVLHILQPTEEFRMIYDGLRGSDPKTRASSRELLEHVVEAPLKDGILAMVDDLPLSDRLRGASAFFDPPGRARLASLESLVGADAPKDGRSSRAQTVLGETYADGLRAMLEDRSAVLRAVASHHIAELGLDELRVELAAASERSRGVLRTLTDQALDLLAAARRQQATNAG
jgi:ATP:ADP antiporter, AAA family